MFTFLYSLFEQVFDISSSVINFLTSTVNDNLTRLIDKSVDIPIIGDAVVLNLLIGSGLFIVISFAIVKFFIGFD